MRNSLEKWGRVQPWMAYTMTIVINFDSLVTMFFRVHVLLFSQHQAVSVCAAFLGLTSLPTKLLKKMGEIQFIDMT